MERWFSVEPPPYTSSIDAAIELKELILPGYSHAIVSHWSTDGRPRAFVSEKSPIDIAAATEGKAATEPLCLLAASIRALIDRS